LTATRKASVNIKEVPPYLWDWVVMSEHSDALGRLHKPWLDEFSQPVKKHVYVERAVSLLRLVFAHLEWAMAQRHNPP
jgi:hypothetical protein